jgi:hypothetical protein
MVARAGAGPDPIPHKQLTADKLADAIEFCLKPESLDRAKQLASKIVAERGSDKGAQSFHQYLEVDRLRCTLAPSRAAVWRIKRTQVRLSAFAACTLANANLLDFQDLKLFRAQEYYTDEGPWDPVSGGFTAACRSFSGMAMGIAGIPSETWRAVNLPFRSSQQQSRPASPAIAGKSETSHPLTSPGQSQTSFNVQESSSSKDPNMLRPTGVHMSKGVGRFVKATVQGPVDISVNLTRGMHNMPKIWGDDTVRPQERVSDFKSGVKAVGREFGFGFYDGITGLVTQPWKGAQQSGASGFVKGFGKGVAGLITKPGAASLGILSYTLQGVDKELQKLFGNNVQTYIVASRVAQGHEEWLKSSDAEKQDVIVRWKLIQKYLKKKSGPDDVMRDVLEAQQKKSTEDRETLQNFERVASSINSADAPIQDPEAALLPAGNLHSLLRPANAAPSESLGAIEINETIRLSAQGTSHGHARENANVERAVQENMPQAQRQRPEAADHDADEEDLRQAMAFSEAEAQRHKSEALEYEEQLKRVMAHSLREQGPDRSDSGWDAGIGLDGGEDEDLEHAMGRSEKTAGKTIAVAVGPPDAQQPPSYDQRHLAGTTQSEFQAQHQVQQGEKTTQEKTEEEIVMEYVKKQSLLELHHQNKGKGRATSESL